MPMVSEAQRRAMHAAAGGKSMLGIPKKVAREYVAHDRGGRPKPRHRTMMEDARPMKGYSR